jgi:hypothetical protein
MQGTGDIDYSLNKKKLNNVLTNTSSALIIPYFIVVFLSMTYIYNIRVKKYFQSKDDLVHFFHSITYSSPYSILKIKFIEDEDNNKYVGLTDTSYLYIIIAYVITLIIILEGLVRNFIYSIYVIFIQLNSNNNPYNNSNCISKISDDPKISISQNYSAIIALALNFLIPFLVPIFIRFFKFDNYDIKKSKWIPYVILFLIFYPLLILIISRASFYKKLEIFPNIKSFVDKSDYKFVDKIIDDFRFDTYKIIVFVAIIFIYSYYKIVTSRFSFKLYLYIFLLLFIFVPIFFIFFGLASILHNKNELNETDDEVIRNIQNNGISGIYDLLVKYNYPCFVK